MPIIDKNEIRQLILNLTRNGMEAMSAGGTLTIGTTTEKGKIVLFIKDEGKGLPVELLDKIGTPFVTTKENGTGLGLAVCYSIAARHNAKMDFETGLKGTTFKVCFPMEDEQITLFEN
jgi:signal transduction histidine kinase